MDTKGKIYVAVSMGYRSITELSKRCNIPEDKVKKICWNSVRLKDMRYDRYEGIEVMAGVVHFYLTRAGRQEMRICCLENRMKIFEDIIKNDNP